MTFVEIGSSSPGCRRALRAGAAARAANGPASEGAPRSQHSCCGPARRKRAPWRRPGRKFSPIAPGAQLANRLFRVIPPPALPPPSPQSRRTQAADGDGPAAECGFAPATLNIATEPRTTPPARGVATSDSVAAAAASPATNIQVGAAPLARPPAGGPPSQGDDDGVGWARAASRVPGARPLRQSESVLEPRRPTAGGPGRPLRRGRRASFPPRRGGGGDSSEAAPFWGGGADPPRVEASWGVRATSLPPWHDATAAPATGGPSRGGPGPGPAGTSDAAAVVAAAAAGLGQALTRVAGSGGSGSPSPPPPMLRWRAADSYHLGGYLKDVELDGPRATNLKQLERQKDAAAIDRPGLKPLADAGGSRGSAAAGAGDDSASFSAAAAASEPEAEECDGGGAPGVEAAAVLIVVQAGRAGGGAQARRLWLAGGDLSGSSGSHGPLSSVQHGAAAAVSSRGGLGRGWPRGGSLSSESEPSDLRRPRRAALTPEDLDSEDAGLGGGASSVEVRGGPPAAPGAPLAVELDSAEVGERVEPRVRGLVAAVAAGGAAGQAAAWKLVRLLRWPDGSRTAPAMLTAGVLQVKSAEDED